MFYKLPHQEAVLFEPPHPDTHSSYSYHIINFYLDKISVVIHLLKSSAR